MIKAIIPTGGRGTRMQPLTFSSNKHFIPIANKPLIFYAIEAVAAAGIKDVAITYNPPHLEEVKSFLGDGSRWGLRFTYVLQEKPAGLANIFQVCQKYLAGSPFVLHLGDNIFADGIKEAVQTFLREKPNAMLLMVRHQDNKRLGVPYFDKKGKLVKYVEKPQNPPNDFGIPGLYFFDKNVFGCFRGKERIKPSARGELEISAPYNWLIEHDYRVQALEYKGQWMDPGKFDDWIEANRYLLKVTLGKKVARGKNCQIIKSEIKGPAAIGDNVTIKDSLIGPFAAISDGCEIVGSRIEDSVLMNDVKIINISAPIKMSLIGTATEVTNSNPRTQPIELFVGERCKIKV